MALTVTQYAQTTHNNEILLGNTEGDFLGKGFFVENFEPGVTTKVFPNALNKTGSIRADGSLLIGSSQTYPAGQVAVQNPHSITHDILYQTVADYGNMIPPAVSRQLGQNFAEERNQMCLSRVAKLANTLGEWSLANKTGGYIEYDASLSGQSASDAIAEAVLEAIKGVGATKSPQTGLVCVLEPDAFYDLIGADRFGNADWTSDSDNKNRRETFTAFGVTFISKQAMFGVNNSANSDWASDFQYDASNDAGILFHPKSFAIHRTEMPSGRVTDQSAYNIWLAEVREIFGFDTIAVKNTSRELRDGHAFVLRKV